MSLGSGAFRLSFVSFDRLFSRLVDSAIYFNCYSPSTKARLSSSAVVTLLVDKSLVNAIEGQATSVSSALVDLAVTAQQSGVVIDTLLQLYQRWQEQENGGRARR